MFSKLIKSIFSNDLYILIFGIVAVYFLLKTSKIKNQVDNDIRDWEEESDELSNNPEKNTKIFNKYKSLNRSYTVFVTIISIFPLLGMGGTVLALLKLDMSNAVALSNAKTSFFDALTSTMWGIIFAIGFKLVNAYFFADVEDIIQRLLSLKKKLIEKGIDDSIKKKSGWSYE